MYVLWFWLSFVRFSNNQETPVQRHDQLHSSGMRRIMMMTVTVWGCSFTNYWVEGSLWPRGNTLICLAIRSSAMKCFQFSPILDKLNPIQSCLGNLRKEDTQSWLYRRHWCCNPLCIGWVFKLLGGSCVEHLEQFRAFWRSPYKKVKDNWNVNVSTWI